MGALITACLGVAVITDARSASAPAVVGTAIALALLLVGLAAGASLPVHGAIALLGVLLLLRHDDRLILAPAYGAGLLAVEVLAARCGQLDGVEWLARGASSRWLGTVVAAVAASAAAGVLVAAAATLAPPRSAVLTVVGTVLAAGVFAGLGRLARLRLPGRIKDGR